MTAEAVAEAFWHGVWNGRNLALLDDLVGERARWMVTNLRIEGREALRNWLSELFDGIDGPVLTPVEYISSSGRVATRFELAFRLDRAHPQFGSKGPVRLGGLSIFHVRRGRIAAGWLEFSERGTTSD